MVTRRVQNIRETTHNLGKKLEEMFKDVCLFNSFILRQWFFWNVNFYDSFQLFYLIR